MAVTVDDGPYEGFFPPPYSLSPLPDDLRLGILAPAICGLLSAVSTLLLIIFILYRLISWGGHYKTFIGYNQYIMLVLNLLCADLIQSLAFLINWRWYQGNEIMAPSSACFAQGWLLHSGDVSSGLFVLAIAVHTFLTAVPGWRIRNGLFYCTIAFIWVFSYVLTFVGVIMHPHDYFVRAGAWCWISSDYQDARLAFHYIWVFIVEFSTIALYLVTFVALRRKTNRLFRNNGENRDNLSPKTVKAVNRITKLMMLYPCVYVVLTLPISSGRMWTMAHDGQATSNAFACTVGALLASCGWVDALLYTLTRKRLLSETMPSKHGRSTGVSEGIATTRTLTVNETAGPPRPQPAMRESMTDRKIDPEYAGHEKSDSVAISEHAFERTPSMTGSIDPILNNGIQGGDLRPGVHYDHREMLSDEREPEYLEMGDLGNGRKGPVPRGSGRV